MYFSFQVIKIEMTKIPTMKDIQNQHEAVMPTAADFAHCMFNYTWGFRKEVVQAIITRGLRHAEAFQQCEAVVRECICQLLEHIKNVNEKLSTGSWLFRVPDI